MIIKQFYSYFINHISYIIFPVLFILHISYFIFHPQVSYAASFKMKPAQATFYQGCDSSVDIFIEAQGGSSNAADIIVEYDPTLVEVTDIVPGPVYQNYFGKVINNGLIRLTGASFSSTFTSWGTFATIKFHPRVNNSTAYFNIRFTGANQYNSLDSNIADSVTSNDLLTSVQNGFYSFTSGSCATDSTPPTITFITPQNDQTNIPPTANIQLEIADSPSGVNINTVEIIINGVSYLASNPQIVYTGNNSLYNFTLTPLDPFFTDSINTLLVKATDLSGNSTHKTITFNQPIAITCPDTTTTPTPTSDSSSPAILFPSPDNPLNIEVSDPNLDPNTIKVSLDDQIFTLANPELTYQNGIISLKLTNPLTPGNHRLTVFVADTSHNAVSQSINFTTTNKPFNYFYLLPLAFLSLVPLFFILRRRHQTGYIFDSTTLLPVNSVTIAIYNQSKKLITTTSTDHLGLFSFSLTKNHYHLSTSHPQYQDQIVSFSIDKKNGFVVIPLKPLNSKITPQPPL